MGDVAQWETAWSTTRTRPSPRRALNLVGGQDQRAMDTSVLASVTAYYIIPVASVSDLQSKLNVCKAYNDSLPARAARGSAFADAKLVRTERRGAARRRQAP
jgi:hypothetical protein